MRFTRKNKQIGAGKHMGKKYELTDETMVKWGVTYRRIRLLRDCRGYAKGTKLGWIEKEGNLDQSGDALVSGNALVSGDARVSGNARVSGDARVYGNARVSGNAQVLVVSSLEGYTLTVWREADGHGANYAHSKRSVDDAELWLPENHRLLAPYLKARVAEWPIDVPEPDPNVELRERLAKAEAEVAAVREALSV
jgi:hypothetical protein